jgi:hypothetical protein
MRMHGGGGVGAVGSRSLGSNADPFYQDSREVFLRAVSVTGGRNGGVRAVVVMPVAEEGASAGGGGWCA